MSKKQEIDDYLKEAVENVRQDRDVTKELLDDVIQFLAKGDSTHREVGLTAAKYVETLQRSNEQMVKVASLIQKEEKKDDGISKEEIEFSIELKDFLSFGTYDHFYEDSIWEDSSLSAQHISLEFVSNH